jgi:hypothetical protein
MYRTADSTLKATAFRGDLEVDMIGVGWSGLYIPIGFPRLSGEARDQGNGLKAAVEAADSESLRTQARSVHNHLKNGGRLGVSAVES